MPQTKLLIGLCILLLLLLARTALRSASFDPREIQLTMFRPFGGCSDEYGGVVDIEKAVGECGIIQVLTNAFNREHEGTYHVNTQTVQAGNYYIRLSASFAARQPPDLAIMHKSHMPDYVARGLLAPVGKKLEDFGVSAADIVPAVRRGVTFNNEMYGLPFDIHGLLWHLNLEILADAGLIDSAGIPVLPKTPEELLTHAKQVKDRTGKLYMTIPSQIDPMPIWTFESWVWQQGADVINKESGKETLETPESLRALRLLSTLYESGYADQRDDYVGAEYSFLNGKAAILANGTWVVDSYLAQANSGLAALKKYAPHTFPKLFRDAAVWCDNHVWVVPAGSMKRSDKERATLSFLRYLYDHNKDWAKTGHLPVRQSVLQSDEFLSLPGRKDYMDTAEIARGFPPVENQRAIESVLGEEVSATWLIRRDPAISLGAAKERVQEILDRSFLRRGERAAKR